MGRASFSPAGMESKGQLKNNKPVIKSKQATAVSFRVLGGGFMVSPGLAHRLFDDSTKW